MSFQKLRALVIEDEAPAREELKKALSETSDFEVMGSADSVDDGYDLIEKNQPDVLFLDIEIIGGNAFQLLSQLKRMNIPIPPVVITTGWRDFDYAKRLHNEFKDHVIYILNKPFWEEWTVHYEEITEILFARRQMERLSKTENGLKKLITISGINRQSFLIDPKVIFHIRTGEKGSGKIQVVCDHKTIDCSMSLNEILAILPEYFIQISRFAIINYHQISMINNSDHEVYLSNGDSFIIGEKFLDQLNDLLQQ